MNKLSNELLTAIQAAKIGAKTAMQYFNTADFKVEFKKDNSPVTTADKQAENSIREYILAQYPIAKFVGEEGGGDIQAETFWIIDPIDGTRSFIRGIPSWCVLIAYCQKKVITHGVCYFPKLNLLITAEKNKGAFVNGIRLKVSATKKFSSSYIAYSDILHFNPSMVANLRKYVASLKSPEITYANYLLVDGKIDVVLDGGAKLWDFAPFKVIVEEAGGKITNFNNKPLKITDEGFIASNGLLHEQVFAIVSKDK